MNNKAYSAMLQATDNLRQNGAYPTQNPDKITQLIIVADSFADAALRAESEAARLGMILWQVTPCLNLKVLT